MFNFIHMIMQPIDQNVVLPVLLFIIVLLCILCLWNTNSWIRAKKKRETAEIQKIVNAPDASAESLESYETRLECSRKLVEAIQYVASEEIASILFTYSALGTEYPLVKLDDDIRVISESVYKGFEPSCLANVNNIFTTEYVLKIINRFVANTFIDVVRTYNTQIHNSIRNPDTGEE